VSAQVEALVVAAEKGDLAALSSLLGSDKSLALATRQRDGVIERCPALARAAALGQTESVRLLLQHGADANAMFRDDYGTALTAACECLAHHSADVVKLLLDSGADPAIADALFMVCSTYSRNAAEKHRIVRMLTGRGETADQHPAVLAIHAGDTKALTTLLARDPGLVSRRFQEVDYLTWPLHLGAPTLLHIAADLGEAALAQLILAAGCDVNVRAGQAEDGCGYQTPVFHCVSSARGSGLEVLKLLIANRADLGVSARMNFPDEANGVCPGAGTIANLKPLSLAQRFETSPSSRNSAAAVQLLRDAGAVE
jgi:ankyrin repeat protein